MIRGKRQEKVCGSADVEVVSSKEGKLQDKLRVMADDVLRKCDDSRPRAVAVLVVVRRTNKRGSEHVDHLALQCNDIDARGIIKCNMWRGNGDERRLAHHNVQALEFVGRH